MFSVSDPVVFYLVVFALREFRLLCVPSIKPSGMGKKKHCVIKLLILL